MNIEIFYNHDAEELHPGMETKIPKGGKYIRDNKEMKEFPVIAQLGDIYIYKNYEYRLGEIFNPFNRKGPWIKAKHEIGWGVRCINAETSEPGPIMESIVGLPVSYLFFTFYKCKNITESPVLPEFSKYLVHTYMGCSKLEEAPILPKHITDMRSTFNNCHSLKTYVDSEEDDGFFTYYKIPENVINMSGCFISCDRIMRGPVLPKGIKYINALYLCCPNLIAVSDIPDSVEEMFDTFLACPNLKSAPVLPKNLREIEGCFEDCVSLETYNGSTEEPGHFKNYILPDSILNVSELFYGCKRLVEPPDLPKNTEYVNFMFADCKNLESAPNLPDTVRNTEAMFMNCKKLKKAPVIPKHVVYMDDMFVNCENLEGKIVIDADVDRSYKSYLTGVFRGAGKKGKGIVLTSSKNTDYQLEVLNLLMQNDSLLGINNSNISISPDFLRNITILDKNEN